MPPIHDTDASTLPLGPLFDTEVEAPHYIFRSFGSGSCGNCSMLTYKGTSILIDLGLGVRIFARTLREAQIAASGLSGILITHDHADHIRGVAPFATRNGLPVFASEEVAHAILTNRYIRQDLSGHIKRITPGIDFSIGDMTIKSFRVPHDAHDNVGYSISSEAGVFTLITDIGHITDEIEEAIGRSNYLVFESNYDEDMLLNGKYPEHLKRRITGGSGHLSNRLAAETITRLYHPNLKVLMLCHLSGDNNSPEIAAQTMTKALMTRGIDLQKELSLYVLKRGEISPQYKLWMAK